MILKALQIPDEPPKCHEKLCVYELRGKLYF